MQAHRLELSEQKIWLIPLLMQLESGMSMRRYLPASARRAGAETGERLQARAASAPRTTATTFLARVDKVCSWTHKRNR